jgi:hypothetical protein
MGVGTGELGNTVPKALTRGTLLDCPCDTTVKPLVPG